MDILNLGLEEIKPYEKNPRNNDNAVDAVAASISEFGFKVPIIIDKDNIIVAGHTRYKAAKKLGLKTVPCIKADDLTDEQVKAFRLADNKVSEQAEWNFELLNEELETITMDMEQFGFDLPEDDEEETGSYKLILTDTDYAPQMSDVLQDIWGLTKEEFEEMIGGEIVAADDDEDSSDDKEKKDDSEDKSDKSSDEDDSLEDFDPDEIFKDL